MAARSAMRGPPVARPAFWRTSVPPRSSSTPPLPRSPMPRHSSRPLARLLAVLLAAALPACASNPDPELEPETAARIAPPTTPIKHGDCAEALRRANADRELYV